MIPPPVSLFCIAMYVYSKSLDSTLFTKIERTTSNSSELKEEYVNFQISKRVQKENRIFVNIAAQSLKEMTFSLRRTIGESQTSVLNDRWTDFINSKREFDVEIEEHNCSTSTDICDVQSQISYVLYPDKKNHLINKPIIIDSYTEESAESLDEWLNILMSNRLKIIVFIDSVEDFNVFRSVSEAKTLSVTSDYSSSLQFEYLNSLQYSIYGIIYSGATIGRQIRSEYLPYETDVDYVMYCWGVGEIWISSKILFII
ncbi:DgyrCDS14514 [Dimorphilus gyrociliatus]|uniref:DgyrCDS14514 n=1 Tax=Dimorphilus gyrociliatus TaxID=2664684 RepID=A0A7I8WE18_9ANNE|nr:DgyrCDS14514 [Dimorphilus gyrociliatus]